MAALVGMKYGMPLQNGKSLVGAVAFFISSIFISIIIYFFISHSTNFIIIILSSLAATLAEFYADQIKINDNLSIPLCYCLTTVILGLIF
jgi:dolichol kinase